MSTKKRLRISVPVMRELMFASGGYCSMDGCRKPLIATSGGWIGTVAHIIAAEDNGPRGDKRVPPKERAALTNLMLMCADHGREVDDERTGEVTFPVTMLRAMKERHEAKVTEAVAAAVEQEVAGLQSADGLLDTSPRAVTVHTTAAGLLESVDMKMTSMSAKDLTAALKIAISRLSQLSQPAVEVLSQLLALWRNRCADPNNDHAYDFGDPTTGRVKLDYETTRNRLFKGQNSRFDGLLAELRASELLADPDEDDSSYVIKEPWDLWVGVPGSRGYRYNFWILTADYLWQAHNLLIDEWVLRLDFAIFDEPASSDRSVQWR